MKAWIPLTLVLTFGVSAFAHADCTYPKSPETPPDGNTASREEMLAAKKDFDRYNGEMNTYLDCLKLETTNVTPKDPSKLSADEKKKVEAQQKALAQKNNAAVDELQAVVGRFNEQLRIYKAKQQQAKP